MVLLLRTILARLYRLVNFLLDFARSQATLPQSNKHLGERVMKHLFGRVAVAAIAVAFAGEAMATEWNVSLWGKRRAFTEHVEKLAELDRKSVV